MSLERTPAGEIGMKAPDFSLPGTDEHVHSLLDVAGKNGLVVAFICNHCPYVKAVIGRFVEDAKALQEEGIGVVAIMPNDWTTHPADAPDRMKAFAGEHMFPFPYLVDESQEVARAYGAVCTPDFFGFDRDLKLVYRGRLDSARGTDPATPETSRELRDAMFAVAESGRVPKNQHASMGCSIKWRS